MARKLNVVTTSVFKETFHRQYTSIINNYSSVYIFRVSEEFGFEDAVSEKYGCEVHSFDTRYVPKIVQYLGGFETEM